MTQTTRIAARPGTAYAVSACFKTTEVRNSARLVVTFFTATGAYIPGSAVDSPTVLQGTQDWTQPSLRRQAPPNTAYLRGELRLRGPGTLWADDLTVTTP